MPIPKNKEKCFKHVKKHHPEWPQDQKVAVCLKQAGESKNEGISFKEYLAMIEKHDGPGI